MIRLMLPVALCLAAPLAAQTPPCPTAEDLATGIRFRIEGGDTETFRRHERPGVIEALFQAHDGYASRVLLGQGLYLLELIELENGVLVPASRTTYGFPQAPDAMPVPVPGGGWTVRVGSLTEAGTDSDTQTYSFGPMTEYSFGACTYRMIPVHLRYASDAELMDVLHYLPDLGISFLSESRYTGGSDSYRYYSVEALR
ncbi:MAG: hypothetical protein KDK26_06090 [Roseivivax sp.]|nr:hypothetical protein [Roseivivax sp.]